jgi:SAM-dependent methyltransferase
VTTSWEQFAQRDPQYYIDPTLGPGVGVDEFREGGRGIVDWAVAWAGELPSHARALEIGCGMGRNTVHLARRFDHVDGVDVSPTMVAAALEHGVPENVALHALSGRDLRPLPDGAFALAFSHLVFQHVESADDIATYVREIGRVLMPGGVAVLHFDTRPQSSLVAVAHRLPDALLPRARRRGIRRQRRDPQQIRAWGRAAGLALEAEAEPGSDRHWVRWRRPASG